MNDIPRPHPSNDAEGLITSFGMLRYAEEYRRAAELVHGNAELLVPAYTLLGHCYELALKAYLIARWMSVEDLSGKPYGHNLTALWDESLKRRIDRLFPMVMLADDVIGTLNIYFQNMNSATSRLG